MSYGAIQSAYTSKEIRTPGVIQQPERCDIDSTKFVDAGVTAGIGMGIVVSRQTGAEAKEIIPGGAKVLGITVRGGERGITTDEDNTGKYLPNQQARVLREGYVSCPTTGTGTAGSQIISYNTTTGAIVLGAPGAGEARLYGLTLEDTVSVSGAVALFKVAKITNTPEGVSSITVGTDELTGDVELTDSGTAVLSVTGQAINVAAS